MTPALTRFSAIVAVRHDGELITAELADGRRVGIPLSWSARLSGATPEQRARYEIEEEGTAIHWPDVDEDIGLSTFLGVTEAAIYEALGLMGPAVTE